MEKTREQLEERKVKGIQKFGGRNLMIWDCVEWNEVGILCQVEGRMNAE